MSDFKFKPTSPLSNYWKIPGGFIWQDLLWPTSEHAYQAAKFMFENAPENNSGYIELIRIQPTPSKAKCLGTQKTMNFLHDLKPLINEWKPYVSINPEWEDIKIEVMKSILAAKCSSPKFTNTLINTHNMVIKEDSKADYFWGIGSKGTGQNILGLLLMELRDSLN